MITVELEVQAAGKKLIKTVDLPVLPNRGDRFEEGNVWMSVHQNSYILYENEVRHVIYLDVVVTGLNDAINLQNRGWTVLPSPAEG